MAYTKLRKSFPKGLSLPAPFVTAGCFIYRGPPPHRFIVAANIIRIIGYELFTSVASTITKGCVSEDLLRILRFRARWSWEHLCLENMALGIRGVVVLKQGSLKGDLFSLAILLSPIYWHLFILILRLVLHIPHRLNPLPVMDSTSACSTKCSCRFFIALPCPCLLIWREALLSI